MVFLLHLKKYTKSNEFKSSHPFLEIIRIDFVFVAGMKSNDKIVVLMVSRCFILVVIISLNLVFNEAYLQKKKNKLQNLFHLGYFFIF